MALVTRFEDLRAWQEARRLVRGAYDVTGAKGFARDAALVDQLRRAAVSALANISEGFDSGSHSEFRRFLRYSVRSASEVQSCAYVALDRAYITQAQFDELYQFANRVKTLCSALIHRLASRPPRRDPRGEVREPSAEWASDRVHAALPASNTSALPHFRTSALPHLRTSAPPHLRTR